MNASRYVIIIATGKVAKKEESLMKRRDTTAFFILVAVIFATVSPFLSGCGGEENRRVEEPGGRPAVLNFWQPG